MMRRLPKYVHGFVDRHGRSRHYFRRAGFKPVSLPGLPWSQEFMEALTAAQTGGSKVEIGASHIKPGTVAAVVASYLRSTELDGKAATTKSTRRNLLERLRREHGDKRLAKLEPQHVGRILGGLRPFAKRNMLLALRALCAFAVQEGVITADPTAGHRVRLPRSGGYKTWPDEFIEAYRQRHPVGTKARLALELLLNVGPRRSDVVKLGRQHLRNGEFAFRAQKNKVAIDGIPMLPEVAAALAALPRSDALTYLTTEYGKAFSPAGFGNWLADRCSEAGIPPGYRAHGLRKASATRLADNGASAHQLMSWFGWRTLREAERYTEAANRKRLARSAGALISGTGSGKPG